MTAPTLSVVISLRDQSATLERAVDSVFRQSRPPNELIIIDDASCDGGRSRAAELASENSNIRLILLEEREGFEKSINLGIEAAYHDFVYCLSAADTVRPGFFERALCQLEEYPHAGLYCGDSLGIDRDLELQTRRPPLPGFPRYYGPGELATRLRGGAIDFHAAVFRRAALLECNGLSTRLGSLSRWFLSHAIAFRFGLFYEPGPAYLSEVPIGVDGIATPVGDFERGVEIRRAIELLKKPQFKDLLSPFCRCASFSVFGNRAVDAVMEDPESWDPVTLMLLRELPQETGASRERENRYGSLSDFYVPEILQPRLDSLVSDWQQSGKKVAIWGAGRFTLALFRLTSLADARIVGILEPDRDRRCGHPEFGIEVLEPVAIERLHPDILLIPGEESESEVRDVLGQLAAEDLEIVQVCESVDRSENSLLTEDVLAPMSSTSPDGTGRRDLIVRIRRLVESWQHRRRRVAIYGAGRSTTDLFRWTNIREAPLVTIVEPIEGLQGRRIWNLEVVAPERLPDSNANTILICTEDFDRQGSSDLLRLGIAGLEIEMLFPAAGARPRSGPSVAFQPLPLL